jgi:O-acetyl-ADP-ribose deacetylase (regulator of RNase III)
MLEFVKGNITDDQSEAVVNTVNCVGVMGKGIALLFKKKYPEMFLQYKEDCEKKLVKIGLMNVYENGLKYIINFPTKKHWKNDSKIEWIKLGLKDLVELIKAKDIKSIAIPALGCGNGGLNWKDVKAEIQRVYDANWTNIKVKVYEPL